MQQYQGIAARSSGYFIIADHGSVYREIPDVYTDSDIEDWSTICWERLMEGFDGTADRSYVLCREHLTNKSFSLDIGVSPCLHLAFS